MSKNEAGHGTLVARAMWPARDIVAVVASKVLRTPIVVQTID